MLWTKTGKAWFSGAFRTQCGITRPVRALRRFSSQAPLVSQYSSRVVLITSLTAGLLGFTIAKSAPSLLSPTNKDHETESTQFGSSDDFKKAIRELQSTFPLEDQVSIDPGDLYAHGFSTNVYHPGNLC